MAKVVSVESKPVNRSWISLLIRGLLIAVAGGFIIFNTEDFITLLTIVIGAWMFITGIIALIGAFRVRDDKSRRNNALIRSILNIVIGALAVTMPFVVASTWWVVLLFIVAIQLCIAAVMEIVIGFRLRSAGLPASGAFTGAAISIAIAALLFLAPEFLGATLVTLIGVIILVLGVLMMAFALFFRFR
ncbi:MAG: DUF308 domain-containing protein [Chloroflexota bacterium]